MKRLTVVIPVYNESGLLPRSFEQILAFLRETADVAVDVVFVNDGSPDESLAVLEGLIREADASARMRVISYPKNRGKGYAVRQGVLAAEGDSILMSDADLSTPLEEWRKLQAALDAGADVACGSRAVDGADVGKPPPFYRRILSKVFNALVCLSGVRGIRDTQCGFKLFHRESGHALFSLLKIRRFAFDVELIAVARMKGMRVAEVPVHWDYSGHSTVRVFSSGSRMLWDLMMLVLRRWFGGYRVK